MLRDLSSEDWEQLRQSRARCFYSDYGGQVVERLEKSDLHLLTKVGGRSAYLFGHRFSAGVRVHIVRPILDDLQSGIPELSFAQETTYQTLIDRPNWEPMLADVRALYARGAVGFPVPRREELSMPTTFALEVLENLEAYPLSVIASADSMLRGQIGEKAQKLSDVAKVEGWFR
jgi:hypothetical protein